MKPYLLLQFHLLIQSCCNDDKGLNDDKKFIGGNAIKLSCYDTNPTLLQQTILIYINLSLISAVALSQYHKVVLVR